MDWTDERVEQMKTLWAEGVSAGRIAAQLGGVTRNAVMGKLHRLGLCGTVKSKERAARTPRSTKSAAPKRVYPDPVPMTPVTPEESFAMWARAHGVPASRLRAA